jgi:hypothetical protein
MLAQVLAWVLVLVVQMLPERLRTCRETRLPVCGNVGRR